MPAPSSSDGDREAPSIVHAEPGCVLAVWRNVLVTAWGTAGTVERAARLHEVSLSLEKNHPEGFSSLHFIASGAGLPDAAARDALGKVASRFGKSIACVGTVIDGKGFWASAIRSFFTSLLLFSRQPYKVHYAATIAELAAWVPDPHAARTGVKLSPQEIERVLLDVCARLRAG